LKLLGVVGAHLGLVLERSSVTEKGFHYAKSETQSVRRLQVGAVARLGGGLLRGRQTLFPAETVVRGIVHVCRIP
jgi:hypothetical protein